MITLVLPYPISEKFGLLTVISRAENDRFGRSRWNCHCECGSDHVAALFRMKSGHTKSCGCIRGADAKHGMRNTGTYNSWCAMKQRCNNPNSDEYSNYGGRGIKVCERWNDFATFLADMGERPEGLTIERKDTDGDYEPGNCIWATMAQQQRNRRSTILIERNGVTKCVKDWCDELGINPDKVYGRIRRGMAPVEALK